MNKMVVVASIPRCRSTMIARAIAGLQAGDTWPGSDFVHKTHSRPEAWMAQHIRVFVFDSPVLAVLSTLRNRWDAQHFKNCGWDSEMEPNMVNRDDLGYRRIFEEWTQFPGTLCIRSSAVWQYAAALESHVQRPMLLPPERRRKTVAQDRPMISGIIEQSHRRLIEEVTAAPDCWVVGGM